MAPFTEDVVKNVEALAKRQRLEEELKKKKEELESVLLSLGKIHSYIQIDNFFKNSGKAIQDIFFCKDYKREDNDHRFLALVKIYSPTDESVSEIPNNLEQDELKKHLDTILDSISRKEEVSSNIVFKKGEEYFGLIDMVSTDEGIIGGMIILGSEQLC